MVTGLPVAHQDFSRLILLSPQAVLTRDSGITIAGQSDRLNGFQIDGATNSDLGGIKGLSGFGTPGSASGVRTLSVEAVQELQILIAPFDVRYGNFAGGLVNAVTRSGSNRWEGSVTSYFQDQSLTGHDSAGNRAADFSTKELTVTLGGPIVRDRAAFFVDAGLQRFVGARGLSIDDTTGGADTLVFGFHRADAERFQDILRNTYHVDPGSIEQVPDREPAGNLFAKVSLWPALNQRIVLSHNYAHGTARVPGVSVGDGGYSLSSMSSARPSTVNATRLAWTMSGTGGLANELTVARLGEQERCLPAVAYPELVVAVGPDPDRRASLGAGAVNSCAERFAHQTVWELTDNASWTMGAHHLTLGTHDELIHLDGVRRPRVGAGRWFFDSLDSLEQGLASRYVRDLISPSAAGTSADAFGVRQVGLYVQDQWTPGVRAYLDRRPPIRRAVPAHHARTGSGAGIRPSASTPPSRQAATSSGRRGSASTMTSARGEGALCGAAWVSFPGGRSTCTSATSSRPTASTCSTSTAETRGISLRSRSILRCSRPAACRAPQRNRDQLFQPVLPLSAKSARLAGDGCFASRWRHRHR